MKVQLDDWSLKVKEYLGAKVLEGEEGNSFYGSRLGNSFRCSVEVWFRGPGFYGYMVLWIPLWIFKDNDNCNVNDNDNDNGNGGEVL